MRTAVVTASYASDFERCRLLCDSLDRRLSGDWCHYILVEAADLARFAALRGPRRLIVDEREILPNWLKPFPDPLSFGRRRVWLSPFTPPLRGWHVQQLRRLGMGRLLSEGNDLFRRFRRCPDARIRSGDACGGTANLRLYRRDLGITADLPEHCGWVRRSHSLLGLPVELLPPYHDYINTLIGWRSDTLRSLLDHLEAENGHELGPRRGPQPCDFRVHALRHLCRRGHGRRRPLPQRRGPVSRHVERPRRQRSAEKPVGIRRAHGSLSDRHRYPVFHRL